MQDFGIVMDVFSGQAGKPKDSVHGRAYIMGHVGEERILCHNGCSGRFQRFFQKLLMLHFLNDFRIHILVSHNDLGYVVTLSHIDNAELDILCLAIFDHTVIHMKHFAA